MGLLNLRVETTRGLVPLGSFRSNRHAGDTRAMSAIRSIATTSVRRSETSRGAKSRLRQPDSIPSRDSASRTRHQAEKNHVLHCIGLVASQSHPRLGLS